MVINKDKVMTRISSDYLKGFGAAINIVEQMLRECCPEDARDSDILFQRIAVEHVLELLNQKLGRVRELMLKLECDRNR